MAAGGSQKVVILALLANGGIAAAKFVAALFTGSGAMLAEAIHSAADCGNQGLLLLGSARARRPADERYPLGYSREAYFWGLMVAVVLFTIGGLFSVYEGVHKLFDPHELEYAGWAIGVLVVAVGLESVSLSAAWREYSRVRGSASLLGWAATTGDVDLLVVVFEDLAAEAGLLIALAAVGLTWATGDTRFDAAGSLGVGIVLLAVAVFVASQVRRLIVGSAADAATRDGIRRVWESRGFTVLKLIAVWTGPGRVLIAAKVCATDVSLDVATLVTRINETEQQVRAAHPEVAYQFVEPDMEE